MDARRQDVHVVFGEYARHIGEEGLPVQRLHLDLHQEDA
jgi:hypothetical protein